MVKRKQSDNLPNGQCFKCIYCEDNRSQEEVIALTSENLPRVAGSEVNDLQYAIAQFIIHTDTNLCSLEDGHIEKGNSVYVCGLLKDVFSDNSHSYLRIQVKLIGPLLEWWFSGFDGSSLMVGIESPYASYLLHGAHSSYQEIFEKLNLKMTMTKFTIESLQRNPLYDFDDFLSSLSENFNSELFYSSIDFIVRHIENYDKFRDDDEVALAQTLVVQTLLSLSRANILLNNTMSRQINQCFRRNDNHRLIRPVNSSTSDSIFNHIFNNIIQHSKNSHQDFDQDSLNLQFCSQDITNGQFVKYRSTQKIVYGRIISQKEDTVHVNVFCSGIDTFLKETLPINVLFGTKLCDNISIKNILKNINVKMCTSYKFEENCKDTLITFLVYDHDSGFFENFPSGYNEKLFCISCQAKFNLDVHFDKTSSSLQEFEYLGQRFRIGDCIFFSTSNLSLPIYDYFEEFKINRNEIYDLNLFPERYRKAYSHLTKDAYKTSDLSNTMNIGCIQEITVHQDTLYVSLNVFYRSQNIFSKYNDFMRCDLNELFWTDTSVVISYNEIVSKCQVFYSECTNTDLFPKGDRFYFKNGFNPKTHMLFSPSEFLKNAFPKMPLETPKDKKHAKVLDLFSGCGGLSYYFASLACELYSIENDPNAAQSYQANFNFAKVFNIDANLALKMLLEKQNVDLSLPERESIDLIISGPPCQGFTEMNRFSFSEYSKFKSSLVGTFLNYIEYYRPKYFLFENVRNLVYYNKSLIFKIIMSFLIHLGYQVKAAIIQAGSYGLPQNRRRLFIIGARCGLPMPSFPPISHIFPTRLSNVTFKIDQQIFRPFKHNAGIMRMLTVDDAIGDLSELSEDDYFIDRDKCYKEANPLCHYQRLMRSRDIQLVSEHYCKQLSDINLERIKRIPLDPGSDWRDLPNIEIRLSNGMVIKKLKYLSRCKSGNRKSMRREDGGAVCECASGGVCSAKQEGTLIPWCLVHTAHRQNHWSGAYGRLSGKAFFPTVTTNPDPISMQGKVIHPNQHRILSVRELARAQGFPDHFRFCGSTLQKYKQIGNSVSPIISMHFATEFEKCLFV